MVKISILADNNAKGQCLAEWGLSVLVETGKERILFDTGSSFVATHNASLMGISLRPLSAIVLSHGHYDHTGGLSGILKQTGKTMVIGHPSLFNPKYANLGGKNPPEYIGMPISQESMQKAGATLVLTREPHRFSDEVTTSGEIPLSTGFEMPDRRLLEIKAGVSYPDQVLDDLALVINTDAGLVIVAGCAHRGIVNTVKHARNLSSNGKVAAIIGGFHLYNADKKQIIQTANYLAEIKPNAVYAGHCTGFEACCCLKEVLGGAFNPLASGDSFTF